MNPDGQPPVPGEPPRADDKKSANPLNLTPEQVRRDVRKLHQLRDDLKNRRSVQDTGMRSSPLGRDD